MDKIIIELEDYDYTCGDGCCHDYGTIVRVNGEELPFRNDDRETILKQVLEHLGYNAVIKDIKGGYEL